MLTAAVLLVWVLGVFQEFVARREAKGGPLTRDRLAVVGLSRSSVRPAGAPAGSRGCSCLQQHEWRSGFGPIACWLRAEG